MEYSYNPKEAKYTNYKAKKVHRSAAKKVVWELEIERFEKFDKKFNFFKTNGLKSIYSCSGYGGRC
jgi:hypothetical protein